MKKLLFSLVLVFATCFAFAQIPPQAFNYSAVARNSVGVPIANSTIGIQISILKTTAIGAVQYSENHFVNTDAFGLFNLIVGAGSIQQGSMSAINWSSDNFYMKVGMDANGGTNFLTMGTTQLLSVPYALHAKTADSVTNGAGAVHIQAGNNVSISGTGTSADPFIVNSTASSNILAPTVTTNNATNILNYMATLNASVNPNSFYTSVSFEYGTSTSYGNTTPALPNNISGNSNTPVTSVYCVNLLGNTTYHYRVIAQNAVDFSYGNDMTFTTPPNSAPTVTSSNATNIASTTAQFNGLVNPHGLPTNVSFQYGTTTSYGSAVSAGSWGNTNTDIPINLPISNLLSSNMYHYRIVAQNSLGTSYGNDITFNTLGQAPLMYPNDSVIVLSDTTFQFFKKINANGLSTTSYFEFGTTTSFGSIAPSTPSSFSGTNFTSVSSLLTVLNIGVTYYYRCVATNSAGTVYSTTRSFTP